MAVKKDVCDNKIFTNDSLASQFYKEALKDEGIFNVSLDTVIIPKGYKYKILQNDKDENGVFIIIEPQIIVEEL